MLDQNTFVAACLVPLVLILIILNLEGPYLHVNTCLLFLVFASGYAMHKELVRLVFKSRYNIILWTLIYS